MMSGGLMGWTVNGVSASGHVHDPIISAARGTTLLLDMTNETAWWHPIHLHGHSFRVLSRNGQPTRYQEWQDTVLMPGLEEVPVATGNTDLTLRYFCQRCLRDLNCKELTVCITMTAHREAVGGDFMTICEFHKPTENLQKLIRMTRAKGQLPE